MSDDQAGEKPEARKSAPKPPDAPKPELKSPRDWALATGNGPKAPVPGVEWSGNGMAGMSPVLGSTAHEVAKKLHGWEEHEHHENGPIMLTREDYLAALAATHPEDELELDDKGQIVRDRYGNPVIAKHAGNPVPHPGALSRHKGGRMRTRLVGGKPVTAEEKAS